MTTAANYNNTLVSYNEQAHINQMTFAACESRDSDRVLFSIQSWELRRAVRDLMWNGELYAIYRRDGEFVAETTSCDILTDIFN